MAVGWQALIVSLLAGSVGLAEIVTRYRSDPKYALRHSLAAWLYVALNAVAGVGALLLIRAFGWTFGQTDNVDLWRVLVAGFAAIAFFRSSLFITKIGGSSVGVGPSLVLGGLLDAFDREVDRKSAGEMSTVIRAENLDGLNPDTVMSALPVLCLGLMQNFPPGDQALLGTELVKIRGDTTLSEQAKMRAVTVQLAKYLGSDLVERVLVNGREMFIGPSPAQKPVASDEMSTVIAEAKRQLAGEEGKVQAEGRRAVVDDTPDETQP